MGTRSAIAYYTDRGTVRGKYSHYDGYPEYTGAVLEEHYTDVARVRNMVDLGDQSYILPEFIPTGKHTFEEPEENVTIFYGRDRGESGVEAREFDTIQEFVDYYGTTLQWDFMTEEKTFKRGILGKWILENGEYMRKEATNYLLDKMIETFN